MGYRHYFYLVDKKDVDKVRYKTYDELLDVAVEYGVEIEEYSDGRWFYFNDKKFMNKKQIFAFGKLYWDDTADRIYDKGLPLFENKDVRNAFIDYRPYVMGKDAVLEAINIYKEKIIKYYKGLIKDGETREFGYCYDIEPEDIKDIGAITRHIEDELWWWERMGAIDTDLENEAISHSWLYEHQIFELVRLYKSIDWENKCLLFYGW